MRRIRLRLRGAPLVQKRTNSQRGAAMNLTTALARLLIFPGLLFAVPAAWFFLWVERKAVALMQGASALPSCSRSSTSSSCWARARRHAAGWPAADEDGR
jgi:hypothetical protein